jgi:glyoxylase-like metal-dependent hydrolase (beta-lactamase superfamily II)
MKKKIFHFALAAAAIVAVGAISAQQQNFDNVQIDVQRVRGNIYMMVGAGGNTTVQVGPEGVLIVDTQYEPLAPKILAEIRKINRGPLRFIVNTHMHPDHVGGNEAFAKAAPRDTTAPLSVIAHENVLNRLSKLPNPTNTPQLGLPTDEYFTKFKDFHFNGEAIFLYHEPAAHTDGDSIVLFRGTDVISTGDVFTPEGYPFIDFANGGSVQGIIDAQNHILELAVPAKTQEGGTLIVPGHGRLSDEADLVEYRDMMVIVRDRIQDLIKKGRTLDQVKAARPTLDYDGRFIDKNSFINTDRFVEAMYKGLGGK